MLSEISQSEKGKYDFTHVELKKQNKQVKGRKKRKGGKSRNRFLTTENKLMVTRGEVDGRIGEIGDGASGRHLL